ncbi:hypothetical protein DVK05_11985 [Halorubrum sp. Atlit-8R]|uniref:DUF7283 family protein n=1 Tax=unclassified Halorubrum TaxID=2642239 RepID=UPI000EF18551|nr:MULTISPECIES: hypothetical protein [unclassified Halorubrum]RLM67438.1 hypothetical protein DVK08_12050 [Halorubrum sp. Atlit-9R]RLM77598.1 hypothetical protein DVK05_11985 [Halorubrum sp. Atlit-8R]
MFETHLDATYAWLGLAVVSVAAVGVAAAFPASPPPDADGVARTVDSVADGEYPATAEHGIAANRIRISAGAVSLGDDRGTAWAALDAPRITPVVRPTAGVSPAAVTDARLRRVLDGAPPDAAFDDPAAFAAAAERARAADATWTPAPEQITVRRVHYGDVRVTLVG